MEPFDPIAAEYQRLYGENPHHQDALEKLSGLLPPGASVLDLGCGSGIPTAQTLIGHGHEVVGVDVSEPMLELARAQVPDARFVQGDMRTIDFGSRQFDAVTAYFSLIMLSRADIELLLRRVSRWLRPPGYLSVSFIDFDFAADATPVTFMGAKFRVSSYSAAELPGVLRDAGFEPVSIDSVEYVTPEGDPDAEIFCLARLS